MLECAAKKVKGQKKSAAREIRRACAGAEGDILPVDANPEPYGLPNTTDGPSDSIEIPRGDPARATAGRPSSPSADELDAGMERRIQRRRGRRS